MQISNSTAQLKEWLSDCTYTDFVDTPRGYCAVKDSSRSVVKVLERAQAQWNLAEDKVGVGASERGVAWGWGRSRVAVEPTGVGNV